MSSRPDDYDERLRAARDYIESRIELQPRIALILGSGLGAFADTLTDASSLAYDDIESPVAGAGDCCKIPSAATDGVV